MFKMVFAFCLGLLLLLVFWGSGVQPTLEKEVYGVQSILKKEADGVASVMLTTADHSRFAELDKPFTSGPEVTRACLKCHNQAATQVHSSIHWTWESKEGDEKPLGKAHVVNNF